MKIREIYKKFKVSPNLQEHHLRVAKVAMFVVSHWIGSKIDSNFIKKEALLHDLGNIVKCDYDKYPDFLGDQKSRIDFWKGIKKEMIAKYGKDDKEATASMLKEIKVDSKIINSILAKGFKNLLKIEKSNNWEAKIVAYADLKVGPYGVVSLEERLEEGFNRYFSKKLKQLPLWLRFPQWLPQLKACKQIEKQIQTNTNADVINLREDQLPKENEEFLNLDI